MEKTEQHNRPTTCGSSGRPSELSDEKFPTVSYPTREMQRRLGLLKQGVTVSMILLCKEFKNLTILLLMQFRLSD